MLTLTECGRQVRTRSFDILPAGELVEFGDQSILRDDVAEASVDLITGIANLTSGQDLAGFFGEWAMVALLCTN